MISAAPSLQDIEGARGHVIFHAAAPGQYAYDDEQRGNGVFTGAIIDGLHCSAPADSHGIVTVASLADYVDARVVEWVHKHRDRKAGSGIQVTTDSGGKSIPVALCSATKAAAAGYVTTELGHLLDRSAALGDRDPASVRAVENGFHVLNGAGVRLWGGSVDGKIARAELVDLDGDKNKEVAVGVAGTGADVGKIIVFNSGGTTRWSRDTTTSFNYQSARSGRMAVMTFATGDLFRNGKREIVALSIDAQGGIRRGLSVFDRDGELLSSYWHPGHLHNVMITAPAATAEPRIIVSGVNNDLRLPLGESGYVSAVFAFDPKRIAGEAPPYAGRSGHGTELWYAAVPAFHEK